MLVNLDNWDLPRDRSLKVKCMAVINGRAKRKGQSTLEYYNTIGKPVYSCCGYNDLMYDEPLAECRECHKFWRNMIEKR